MSRVLFNKVTKSFDRKVKAVDEVTMEIADREFFVIVGPSGCGKSTVLRLIAGLEEPDSGEIYIGDRLVNNIEPRERDIAMVFQNYALYPHMTVFENMAFALKLRRIPKEEITKRVLEAAQILGISDLLDRKPAALSGGQRQRVAVGRAIVRNPKVFLFDEPLSNLDAKLRVGMRAELARLHQRLETTVCYVTHDQVEAMTLGQRIGVMKEGRLLQIADPNTLYNHPVNRFVAGFIGSPPMNFLSGRIEPDPLRFIHQAFTITLPAPLAPRLSPVAHQPVILGVRPENVSLTEESGISGLVEVTEPMGHEVIAYLKVGSETVIARLPNDQAPRPGQTVHLHFDPARLHFFDPVTELALT
ncbi:MAG: sn-glycerol-3-phosphate ABC transporter ATP-binding protein UgpC [candidate division WOR-3 bacterium]